MPGTDDLQYILFFPIHPSDKGASREDARLLNAAETYYGVLPRSQRDPNSSDSKVGLVTSK